ncbi:tRNA1(Val) (adenine(37)-N6)-methyltransferase [Cloacibacterium caeni]|uniref:tRNA1(Val) (adenine(37)-N6)-methyltransferase n=1 Tax=Cloacibacterium caeni TaxID=2004710 RepID=UPI001BCAAA88|nr:methyltransferase [Cloacibacterium caeni]
MKPFRFQKFDILQHKNVFRVGTDGVLLGALCQVENAQKILEVGTGTGLISLMLAQRNANAEITALDLNEDAVKLAQENFKNSPFSERLQVFHQDFKTFESQKEYDFVVCNPPFFEENNSVKDILARQQVELTFRNLIQKTARVLSSRGIFSVIIPSESAQEFENLAEYFDLYLVRKVNIFGIENGVLKRNVLEFSKKKSALETLDFTIEKSPRKYSDQYLELTKEFHVFGK